MPDSDIVIVERHGPVVRVRLNRPDQSNSLDEATAAALARAAAAIDADAAVRAVVLTGSGRFFCAGGDVVAMGAFGERTRERVKALADDAHRAVSAFARMRAPLIVAVNGTAAGGGFSIAMTGDLVIAAESARFTMAYTRAGLSPDGSSTWYLPRLIGVRRLQALLYLNPVLSAREALAQDLVHRVVPDGALQDEAMTLARQLAIGPVGAHAACKRLLAETFANGLETQMELEGRLIAAQAASDEGQEGLAAFRERRVPRFL